VHDAERLALGLVAAERARRANVTGAEVVEIDGLVLAIANLPDPALSSVVVAARPADAAAALRTAESAFEDRGMSFGIDLQVGRHPEVDREVDAMGLVRIIERPGMVADPRSLRPADLPPDVSIKSVETDADVEGIVEVGVAAFDDDPAVGRAFYGAGARGRPDVKVFLAMRGADPVGIASGYRAEDGATVGVMGVGVVPEMRGKGLGSALTVLAARSFPGADLAWLHPSDEARSMYARLGFRSVADWEVWTRHPAG
jgi:GNAT superfamily N-acetyltransferase